MSNFSGGVILNPGAPDKRFGVYITDKFNRVTNKDSGPWTMAEATQRANDFNLSATPQYEAFVDEDMPAEVFVEPKKEQPADGRA